MSHFESTVWVILKLFLKKYLFIWLCWVSVAACGIFHLSYAMQTLSCGKWDLGPWSGIKPRPPALGGRSLSHWTTRKSLYGHLKGNMQKCGFPGGLVVKNLPAIQEMQVRTLGQEDPLEKEMATHSSILAWKIPWTEEPRELWSIGSHRVRHDWVTEHTCMQECTMMYGKTHHNIVK